MDALVGQLGVYTHYAKRLVLSLVQSRRRMVAPLPVLGSIALCNNGLLIECCHYDYVLLTFFPCDLFSLSKFPEYWGSIHD